MAAAQIVLKPEWADKTISDLGKEIEEMNTNIKKLGDALQNCASQTHSAPYAIYFAQLSDEANQVSTAVVGSVDGYGSALDQVYGALFALTKHTNKAYSSIQPTKLGQITTNDGHLDVSQAVIEELIRGVDQSCQAVEGSLDKLNTTMTSGGTPDSWMGSAYNTSIASWGSVYSKMKSGLTSANTTFDTNLRKVLEEHQAVDSGSGVRVS